MKLKGGPRDGVEIEDGIPYPTIDFAVMPEPGPSLPLDEDAIIATWVDLPEHGEGMGYYRDELAPTFEQHRYDTRTGEYLGQRGSDGSAA
jgi:hypothetical protein